MNPFGDDDDPFGEDVSKYSVACAARIYIISIDYLTIRNRRQPNIHH